MFSKIAGQQYWIFITSLSFLYDLFICLVYFRTFFGTIFSQNEEKHYGESSVSFNNEDKSQSKEMNHPSNDIPERAIDSCMDEINAFFENQKKSKAIKSELIYDLYTILQKYPSLRHSDYKEALTNLIANGCETICSIHLSVEELKGVWLG